MPAPIPMPRYAIEQAVRGIKNIVIGLVGPTHAGKTCSALRLAVGMAGPEGEIVLLDNEFGKPTEYAPRPGELIPETFDPANPLFRFKHLDLPPPYTPNNYRIAVSTAARLKPRVLIIDSFTEEWYSILEMVGDDSGAHGRNWAKPREEHRALIRKMRQHPWYVILCIGANQETIDEKTKGMWKPICDKSLPGDSTIFQFLHKGIPNGPGRSSNEPWKIPGGLRGFIPLDKPLDEAVGRAIAEWAQPQGDWASGEGDAP